MHDADDMMKVLERAREHKAIQGRNRIKGLDLAIYKIQETMNSEAFKPRTHEHHAMVKLVSELEEYLEEHKKNWFDYCESFDLDDTLI